MSRKLIYIGGWGRSGSSVLANVLGSHQRAASIGEVRYLWDRGILEDKTCGCGQPFSQCEYWQSVASAARIPSDPEFALEQLNAVGSKATLKQLIAMLSGRTSRYRERNAEAIKHLRSLYESAADVLEVDALVDASKTPPYAINLLGNEQFKLYFIHLVRDPRAVAHSWSRKLASKEASGEFLPRYSSFKSAYYWIAFNLFAVWFRFHPDASYLRVRYEDFCEHPRPTVGKILEHCGLEKDGLNWENDELVEVTPQHSISGNPSRFNVGTISIQPDNEWKEKMPRTAQRIVTLMCSPLLKAFGYSLRSEGRK